MAGSRSRSPVSLVESELRRVMADPELRVLGSEPVAGGCIHEAVRLRTTRGDFFAKWNASVAPDLFLAEAVLKSLPKPKPAGPVHPFADEEMWGGRPK